MTSNDEIKSLLEVSTVEKTCIEQKYFKEINEKE